VSSASPATEPTLRKLEWQGAAIAAIVPRTPTIASFMLKPARPFAWRAGQHVDIRLTAGDGYQAQRSYSIASARPGGAIELAIERMQDGEVSDYFHTVARVGDVVELRGPIGGRFVWGASDGGPVLLLGGGSGLVPLMSMVRHRAESGSAAPMLLLLSARTWADLLYRDEILTLADRRDGFEAVFAITREGKPRPRHYARRVDPPMIAELLARLPAPPKVVYVCGSNRFAEAGSQAALAAGIPRAAIRIERYGN
jgi:ferredoxin-NADP reductase